LAVALAAGLVDFMVRFPAMLRTLALAAAVAAVAVLLWKRVLPALRFRPSLSSFALRAEKKRPELKGVLAAAVDFAEEPQRDDDPRLARGLSNLVIADAASRFKANRPGSMIDARPALRSIGKLLVVAAFAAALAVQAPTLFGIGAQRVLAPWTGAEWPKRTAVADITDLDVHPRGAAIPLRAALVKTARDPEDASVFVDYRPVADSGRAGATRTALLTYQGRTVDASSARAGSVSGKGALFERLVEADASAVEYRFRTSDDETAWRRVRLVEPPAVRAAVARITPPRYASALARAEQADPGALATLRDSIDLGAGRDERAVAPPSLVGSTVELVLHLNKPLPAPTTIDTGFLAAAFGEPLASIPDARFTAEAQQWAIAFTLPESVRIPVALRDEFGIESTDPAVFRFDAIDDREPGVSITDPQSDLHVLPTARVPVVAEARDDVGLDAAWVSMRRFAPEGGTGPGGALQPVGDPAELALARAQGAREVRIDAEIDLAALEAEPGEEFEVLGHALDIRMRALGAEAAPSRSQPRRIRVISESEFIEELRSELASVRADAIRAEQQQREVQSQTQTRGSDRVTRRGQSLVGERLARQRDAIARLQERIQRNNLDDPRIGELLAEADAALQRAGEAAAQAQDTLEDAARQRRDELVSAGEQPPAPGDEVADLDEDQSRAADREQQEVRDQLSDLLGLLDAGEDNWVARRSLERLLEEQRALREDTARAGAQTAGAELDQLSQEQRDQLQDLAQRQRELAEQTEQTAEDLRERAEQLQENDPTAAAGMREAARRLEQARTAETQRQAAQNAQQNRTNDANQQQDQASQSIQDALDNLERGEDARRDQLRRRLASIIESLQALVDDQQRQLADLNNNVPDLDQGMIALNRNTLGVLDLANAGGRELAPVARAVARASDAQSDAIVALRTQPAPDIEAARDAEERSLIALREALDTAQRLDQQQEQIENRRKLAELRQRYRALLEREVVLRAALDQFATKEELNRRERFEVRSLAEEQVAIADELALIREETRDLAQAKVFDFAQRSLERDTADAASSLRDAEAANAIPPVDGAVSTLSMLVRALENAERQ
ncbi:MAG: hypothetical protein ACTS27_11475, partial [Phycisphaerales bacterium]